MFVALTTCRCAVKLKLGGIALGSVMPPDKVNGILSNILVWEKVENKTPAMSRAEWVPPPFPVTY